MPLLTYYVALPFVWEPEEREPELADLVPGDPVPCDSAEIAVAMAQRLVIDNVGAIAFSRTGDTDTGIFANAVVLARFGRVGKVE